MKCFYHKDRKATKSCGQCGRFICDEDAVELESGMWCKHCLNRLAKDGKEESAKKEEKAKKSEAKPAGLVSRVMAFGMDFGIIIPVSTIVYGMLTGFQGNPLPGAFIFSVVGALLYEFIFTAAFGKTMGKLILGIRVEAKGKKPDVVKSAIRSGVKVVSAVMAVVLPALFWPVGILLSMAVVLVEVVLVAFKKKAIHDYAAGTSVVH